jgi:hypothetical protein
MKVQSIPKRGRKGSVIYSETRHGKVARAYVPPRNPRTAPQQDHRHNVRAVSARWSTLTPEQRSAWCVTADGAARGKVWCWGGGEGAPMAAWRWLMRVQNAESWGRFRPFFTLRASFCTPEAVCGWSGGGLGAARGGLRKALILSGLRS